MTASNDTTPTSSQPTKTPSSTGQRNKNAFNRMADAPHQHGSITAPLNAAMLTLAAGGIVHIAELPWQTPAGFGAVAAISGYSAAKSHVYGDGNVPDVSGVPRRAGRYAATCITCAGAWITYAAIDSPYTPLALAALAGSLLTLGPSYSSLRRRKRAAIINRENREAEAQAQRDQQNQDDTDATAGPWPAILADVDSRLAGVRITHRSDWDTDTDGNPLGVSLTCEIPAPPDGRRTIEQDEVKNLAKSITMTATHRLRKQGIRLPANAVEVETTQDYADLFKLHVQLSNPLAAKIAVPHIGTPGDANDGFDIGRFKDGARVLLELIGKHLELVGGTRSGKSALLISLFLQITRCSNAVMWVGGVAKLMPLITPLCLPWWRGDTRRPPFDYIAGQSHDQVMKMLFDLMCLIDDRTKIPKQKEQREPTADMPLVVAVIEECPRILEDPTKVPHPRTGVPYTASQALAEVLALGGSENVAAIRAGQYGLYSASGDAGSKMKRNTANRILLWTQADQDGSSVLGKLGNKITPSEITNNTFYAVLGENARLMQGKSYFADEDHGEISAAVIANDGLGGTLDAASTDNLPHYADRWSRARQADIIDHKNKTLVAFGIANEEDLKPAPKTNTTTSQATPQENPTTGNTQPIYNTRDTHQEETMFGPAPDLRASMEQALRKQGLDPNDYLGDGKSDTTETGNNDTTETTPDSDDIEAQFRALVGDLDKLHVAEPDRPTPPTQQKTTPEPLGTIVAHLENTNREFISVGEAAELVGMDAGRLGAAMRTEPIQLESTRRRSADYDGNPKTGWLVADLTRRARELAQQ